MSVVTDECSLSFAKGGQRYVWVYEFGQESALLGEILALAGDPASEFDFFDAAVMAYALGERIADRSGSVTV